jgi:hypothetical protein
MVEVNMTEQEKKDVAVIYGFQVDVWTARQSKTVEVISSHSQEHRNVRYINNSKKTA